MWANMASAGSRCQCFGGAASRRPLVREDAHPPWALGARQRDTPLRDGLKPCPAWALEQEGKRGAAHRPEQEDRADDHGGGDDEGSGAEIAHHAKLEAKGSRPSNEQEEGEIDHDSVL